MIFDQPQIRCNNDFLFYLCVQSVRERPRHRLHGHVPYEYRQGGSEPACGSGLVNGSVRGYFLRPNAAVPWSARPSSQHHLGAKRPSDLNLSPSRIGSRGFGRAALPRRAEWAQGSEQR